jgi:DNA ligase-associated metallophosphoesterase
MTKPYEVIQLCGEDFYLLPQRAMFRPSKRQLIISDLHLGKATHFRKQGIAIPAQSHLKDIDKLQFLLNTWKPESVLILGDLFHSTYNKEWLWFKALLIEYHTVQFILVEGNHDILDKSYYSLPNLKSVQVLEDDNYLFSHHQLKDSQKYNICGHVHPGLVLYGPARQSMRLPCFYLQPDLLIMPAFGHLTGLHILKRAIDVSVYVILENSVVKVNSS